MACSLAKRTTTKLCVFTPRQPNHRLQFTHYCCHTCTCACIEGSGAPFEPPSVFSAPANGMTKLLSPVCSIALGTACGSLTWRPSTPAASLQCMWSLHKVHYSLQMYKLHMACMHVYVPQNMHGHMCIGVLGIEDSDLGQHSRFKRMSPVAVLCKYAHTSHTTMNACV